MFGIRGIKEHAIASATVKKVGHDKCEALTPIVCPRCCARIFSKDGYQQYHTYKCSKCGGEFIFVVFIDTGRPMNYLADLVSKQ